MFGRPVPEAIVKERGEPVRYWGARAIFHARSKFPIDLLHDRQSCKCREGKDPQVLIDWLNNVGLPRLKEMTEFKRLSPDSSDVVELKDGQFTLQCSPNASYGYLYIGVWQYYSVGCEFEMQNVPAYVVPTENNKDPRGIKWSNKEVPPPPIGAKVTCSINGEWHGTVRGYFVERGWLGVEVEVTRRPKWRTEADRREKRKDKNFYFFGCDLKKVTIPKNVA